MVNQNALKLKTYETVCVTKVDMPEDKFTTLVDRCKNSIVENGKGEWLTSDDWGKAKIAFTIGKDNRGRWSYFRFKSTPEGVNELRRALKINEFVLRELTVKASEDGKDYESLKATMPQDLIDREKQRDWRGGDRERGPRRPGGGGRGGYGGGGYGDRGGFGGRDGGDMDMNDGDVFADEPSN